jgi:hypothetical protein
MENNNDEPVYSQLDTKPCEGVCSWSWSVFGDPHYWYKNFGCEVQGCGWNCPTPSFDGSYDGEPATTECSP